MLLTTTTTTTPSITRIDDEEFVGDGSDDAPEESIDDDDDDEMQQDIVPGSTAVEAQETTSLLLPRLPPPPAADAVQQDPWRPYVFLPVILLFGFAYSMLRTPLEIFYIQRICAMHQQQPGNGTHIPSCTDIEVQRDVAQFHAAMSTILIVPSLFTSIPIGFLSDIVGRKPIFTLLSFGLLLETWNPFLLITFNLPLSFVFISKFIIGICGGFAVLASVGYASLVDITTTENRAAVLGTMTGIGVVASLTGTFLGGWITGSRVTVDAFLPVFRASATLSSIGIFYIVFVLPETKLRRKSPMSSPISFAGGFAGARNWILKEMQAFRPLPPLIVVIQIIIAMAFFKGNYHVQYTNYKFGWSTLDASVFAITQSILSGLFMSLALPTLERTLRRHFTARLSNSTLATTAATTKRIVTIQLQQVCLRIFLAFAICGSLMYALAPTGAAFFAAAVIDCVTEGASLAIRLMIPEFVGSERVASVMAVIALLDSMFLLFSLQIAAVVYPNIYYLSAGIYFVAFIVSLILRVRAIEPRVDDEESSSSSPSVTTAAAALVTPTTTS